MPASNPQSPVPSSHYPLPNSQFMLPTSLGGTAGHPLWKQKFDWLSEKGQEQRHPWFCPRLSACQPVWTLSSFHIDLQERNRILPGATAQWPLNAAHTRSQFLSEYYFCFFSFLFITELCLPRILWSLLIWVLSTLWWHGCSSTLAQA